MNRLLVFVSPLLFFFFWIVLIDLLGVIDPLYIPPLQDILAALKKLFSEKKIWTDIGFTLKRIVSGFTLAAVCAIPLGIFVGSNKKIYTSIEFVIDFFRSLPPGALFPLFLLFFGLGESSKIAITVFLGFWPILINTIYGVWQVPILHRYVVQIHRATPLQSFTYIYIHDAVPHIFAGLKTALSLCVIILIIAEMYIGAEYGLGKRIFDSYTTYQIPELYAGILLTGFIGYLLNKIFLGLEKKIVFWK